ncbi:hypothetical protein D3C76_1461890 [compost metagenome]
MIFSSKNSVLFLITGKLQGPALLTMKTNCLSGCLSIGMNLVGVVTRRGYFGLSIHKNMRACWSIGWRVRSFICEITTMSLHEALLASFMCGEKKVVGA